MYGDAQLARYAEIAVGGAPSVATLDDLGVDLALVRADSPLVAALEATRWRRLGADAVGVLLASPGAAP